MRQSLLALVLTTAVAAVSAPWTTVAAETKSETCIGDWSIAAQIVKEEKLATVEELANAAKHALGGAVVRTALCREDGRYVYSIVIRKRGGELSRARVDARKPF